MAYGLLPSSSPWHHLTIELCALTASVR